MDRIYYNFIQVLNIEHYHPHHHHNHPNTIIMVKEDDDNVNPLHELELQKIPSKYFRLMIKGTKEDEQERSSATSQDIEVYPISSDKVEECQMKLEFRSKLDDKLEAECVRLFLDNMKEEYERSSWGLDMDEKLREFRHEDARFLILRDSKTGEMNAFSHIRFEEDGILFVWEIQVEACCRGLGQGGLLMAIIDSLVRIFVVIDW